MLFDLPNDDILYDALLARSSDYEGQAYVCVKIGKNSCKSCWARPDPIATLRGQNGSNRFAIVVPAIAASVRMDRWRAMAADWGGGMAPAARKQYALGRVFWSRVTRMQLLLRLNLLEPIAEFGSTWLYLIAQEDM